MGSHRSDFTGRKKRAFSDRVFPVISGSGIAPATKFLFCDYQGKDDGAFSFISVTEQYESGFLPPPAGFVCYLFVDFRDVRIIRLLSKSESYLPDV
jgi:hypothetical protein